MFSVRAVRDTDLEDLYKLSSIVFFINLPNDKKVIEDLIKKSIKSFKSPSDDLSKNHYFFVLEDLEKGKVIGVSMIHAQHGTENEPHFFLRISQEYKYSKTINTGFIHGTLKLGLDTNGPTEIGGLVISPEYRGHEEKLGKLLSFTRFLYIGLNPERFKTTLHSELMPPLDKDGKSPLWEAIGRRFMNMDYYEADKLSRNNKEFILSLYPSDNIYQTLLPIEARNAIGKVGKDTLPVKSMLEKIGFTFSEEVDPFDGGPHYKAQIGDVSIIKSLKNVEIEYNDEVEQEDTFIASIKGSDLNFISIKVTGTLSKDGKKLTLPSSYKDHILDKTKIDIVDF
jgi:arginine N-succinyltransferase